MPNDYSRYNYVGINMNIKKGLPERYNGFAAEFLLNALGEKFIPILGKKSNAQKLLQSSINSKNCFCVEEDGNLLGVLAFQTIEGSFINPSLKILFSIYGFFLGTMKAIGLSMLQHKTKARELYVEAVAVSESARGKGIGTKLFDSVFEFATNNGYGFITLQVIDINPRAKDLYEKIGFTVIKRSSVWPMNRIISWPFKEVFLMKKMLKS